MVGKLLTPGGKVIANPHFFMGTAWMCNEKGYAKGPSAGDNMPWEVEFPYFKGRAGAIPSLPLKA